jgi:tetratricopeptide (TPR) repeat protein
MISASGDSTGPLLEEYPMPEKAPSILLLDHALTIAFGIACDLTRAETLEGLALAYAEAGQTARAATILRRIWQMARGLPKPSDQTWQLRWLAEACVEANLEELALAVAADLVQASDRASVSVDLAQHHIRAGRTQQATARLAQALELARTAQQSGEDASFALREIAETAVELGLIDHAVQVASALEPDWLAIQALCAVAVRCAQTWQHELVAAIFDRALHRIAALASEADRASRLVELVKSRVQARILDHTPVLQMAETIEPPEARARVLLAMATSAADLGDRNRALAAVDRAYGTARTIQAAEAGAKILAAVADLYRQVGVLDRAAEVRRLAQHRADAVEPAHTRAEALVAVAASHAKAGESEAAEKLLGQAVAPLAADQRGYWDASACLDLAEAFHHSGQPTPARAWLALALEGVPQVAEPHDRTTVLQLIAHAACDLGDDDLALQATQGMGKGRIKRLDARAFHLALIAGGLARRGHYVRALQVVEAIPEGAHKTSALDDIATAYIDVGGYQKALHTIQRIKHADSRAWAMVWALVRTSRRCDEQPLGDGPEFFLQRLLWGLSEDVSTGRPQRA